MPKLKNCQNSRLLAAEIFGKIRLDDIITRSSSLLYYDLANVISLVKPFVTVASALV